MCHICDVCGVLYGVGSVHGIVCMCVCACLVWRTVFTCEAGMYD